MLVRFYYSYDQGTEAVNSIQSIIELYRFLLLFSAIARTTATESRAQSINLCAS